MSVKHGYQPMHPPHKPVSHDRMQEILRKHAKAEVKAWPSASESAPPPPPPRPKTILQWQKPEPGATGVRTVCEWYSCCKVMLDGKWVYEVWTREPLTSGMKNLAMGLASFEEGQKIAQADADAKALAQQDSAK